MPKGLVRYQKCRVFHFLTFSWRVAPVLTTFPNRAAGAPGPSPLGTGEGGALLRQPICRWRILMVHERRDSA
jgi:hypothetical protein